MAGKVSVSAKGYSGIQTYWNYRNEDSGGAHPGSCCGIAAVYSVAKTLGKVSISFPAFVKKYPPNMLGGSLGCNRERVEEVLKACGFKYEVVRGGGAMRQMFNLKRPAIICIDCGALPGATATTLHWTAIFGCTRGSYYMTNMATGADAEVFAWTDIEKAWDTWLTSIVAWTSGTAIIPKL